MRASAVDTIKTSIGGVISEIRTIMGIPDSIEDGLVSLPSGDHLLELDLAHTHKVSICRTRSVHNVRVRHNGAAKIRPLPNDDLTSACTRSFVLATYLYAWLSVFAKQNEFCIYNSRMVS